jgi:cyclin B
LIDRYLERNAITRQKLQLVGVAAMLIACKYEEIYAPEVKDFVYVTDKAYTREEVLDMEGKILASLQFNITTPSSYRFLERYTRLSKLDDKATMMSRYAIELAMIDYKCLKYTPSLLAVAAVYLASKLYKREAWPEALARNSKFTEQQVITCAKDLCGLVKNAEKMSVQAVRRKFSSAKFLEVAKIQFEKA